MTDTLTPAVPRRRRRHAGTAVTMAVLAAGATAVGYAAASRPDAAPAAAGPPPTSTATVTRGTVTERIQVTGSLGFHGSYPVIDQAPAGILTSVAQPGTVVRRGGVLFSVDDHPVRLLFGDTPAYRDLSATTTDGPDVQELEANLVAMGMDPQHDITVNQHFTAATAAAIRRWQAGWGLPTSQQTGALAVGQVVFLPAELRVSEVRAQAGATVGADSVVLTATSTNRVVTAALTPSEQTLVRPGVQVLVTVAGHSVPSRLVSVGTAQQPAGQQQQQPAGGTDPVTVPATFSLRSTAGLPPGGVPVQVAITTATHVNVLDVPVTALLARPGGGYEVRLASGRDIQVQPGLFDETAGTVEVSGPGLAVGQRVEVPTS